MNNIQNFDMLSRTLKQERDQFNQSFEAKQEAKSQAESLTTESLTAPFIEASGLNLLKKGISYGARNLGFNEEQLAKISDIGDDLKNRNIGSAVNKVRSLRKSDFINEEQKNFLDNASKKLDDVVKGNPVQDIKQKIKSGIKTKIKKTITEQDKPPRVLQPEDKTTVPTLESQDDLTKPSKFSLVDAGTGQEIKPPAKPVIKTTPDAIYDSDGNEIEDEFEKQKNIAESVDQDEDPIAYKQAQRTLADLQERTQAPEPETSYQSAMDFLAGKKGSASAKWGRKPADLDALQNVRTTNEPTFDPSKIGIKVLPTEGQNNLSSDSKGVSPEEIDKVMNNTSTYTKEQVSEVKAGRQQISNRYNNLNQKQQRVFNNEFNKTKQPNLTADQQGAYERQKQNIQNASDAMDKAEASGQTPQKPISKPNIAPEEPEEEPDTESLGKTISKSFGEGAEIDAEGGGFEDPIGDILALGAALGGLIGGLKKAHETSKPPPVLQINPTIQLGQGQV